ncbi:MAG TPA: RT0821/Lpp0805 family surface protein [Alphaproteobacteria bacterium]|nr:RT0821/Lpp0805 family surface protein [Alphaproteobacteria bacterium]
MTRSLKLSTLLLAAALALTACQSDNWGQKQTLGTMGGAAAGGLIGSQFGKGTGNVMATVAGVALGGWLGNEIGASLDSADRAEMQRAQMQAYNAPVGQSIRWNNPQSGHSGTFVPVRDGTAGNGAYCREFQQTVMIGGRQQQAYGTACRQPDGSWQIVK